MQASTKIDPTIYIPCGTYIKKKINVVNKHIPIGNIKKCMIHIYFNMVAKET